MDKRTKILAGLFGAMIAYGFISKIIYPAWVEPLLTIDDRIADRQKDLDTLEAQVAEVNKAKYEYREWVARTGGFDINEAVTEIRERLNGLLAKHKLADVKVTPTRPTDDRKTKLWKASVTVSGAGSLESVIQFLRDVAELPHVCRIGNASISPASVRGRNTTINRFSLRVPVEVWSVPQHRLVGRLEVEDLLHPELFIRHQGRDYTSIWKGDPFNPYVEMRVKTKPTLTVLKGRKMTLDVTVEGGVGPYQYLWKPSEGLGAPTMRSPALDSSKVGRVAYNVTVTDARGNTGNSSISVTVADPPPPPDPTPPPKQEPRPVAVVKGREVSKNGRTQTLTMVLLRESEADHRDEIMVNDARSKANSYYATGDQFEGGELIFVHQSGGVVNWKEEYYVYPLGQQIDQFVSAKDAFDYPVLQRAAGRHMDLMKEMARLEDAKKKAKPPLAKKPDVESKAVEKSPTKQKSSRPAAAAVKPQKNGVGQAETPVAKSSHLKQATKSPSSNAPKTGVTKKPASATKKQPSTPGEKNPDPAKGKKRGPGGKPE